MFFKPKLQVIEVEKPKPVLDPESQKAVPTLAHNPGFLYLVNKLKLQRAALETTLRKSRHDDIRQVDFLQSGILWLGYIEDLVNAEVFKMQAPTPQGPVADDELNFRRAMAAIEQLGRE